MWGLTEVSGEGAHVGLYINCMEDTGPVLAKACYRGVGSLPVLLLMRSEE